MTNTPPIGTNFDCCYSLIKRIGSGGFDDIYPVHHETLKLEHGAKSARPGYANEEEFVEHFGHKARSAASLSHLNIVRVYDQVTTVGRRLMTRSGWLEEVR